MKMPATELVHMFRKSSRLCKFILPVSVDSIVPASKLQQPPPVFEFSDVLGHSFTMKAHGLAVTEAAGFM